MPDAELIGDIVMLLRGTDDTTEAPLTRGLTGQEWVCHIQLFHGRSV
jgi:hypothetical protein